MGLAVSKFESQEEKRTEVRFKAAPQLNLAYLSCTIVGFVGSVVLLKGPLFEDGDSALWEDYHDKSCDSCVLSYEDYEDARSWCKDDERSCSYFKAASILSLLAAIGFIVHLLFHVSTRSFVGLLRATTAIVLVFLLTGWALVVAAFDVIDLKDKMGLGVQLGILFWSLSLILLKVARPTAAGPCRAHDQTTDGTVSGQPAIASMFGASSSPAVQMSTQPQVSPMYVGPFYSGGSFCVNCGTKISAGNFCPMCGTPVSQVT